VVRPFRTLTVIATVVTVSVMTIVNVAPASPASSSLSNSIAAARQIARVSPIAPDPRRLNVATPWLYSGLKYAVQEKCFRAGDLATLAAPKPCMGGDTNSATTIVIFGDSSVGSWTPALRAAGKTYHWRVASFQYEACAMAFLAAVAPTCRQFHQALPDAIAKLQPAVVIGVGGTAYSKQSVDTVFAAGVEKAVNAIRAKSPSAQYVVWGTTPQLPLPAATCLNARPTSMNTCGVSVGSRLVQSGPYSATEARDRRSADLAQATFVPVEQWFCANGWCPAVVDHTLVYADFMHVSERYSQLLAPSVGEIIRGILNSGSSAT